MFGFERAQENVQSGDCGAVVIPVPIPNTEVKHRSGDDSSLGAKVARCRAASSVSLWRRFFLILLKINTLKTLQKSHVFGNKQRIFVKGFLFAYNVR